MKVATVDGIVTLFYDGSKPLFNEELNGEFNDFYVGNDVRIETWESWPLSDECKDYIRERLSWQQVIVQEGVTEIPFCTFYNCHNIERVIFADSVIRIGKSAFHYCKNLLFIKWPLNLQLIGEDAFRSCNLSSVFIPLRCRYIGYAAFAANTNLTILNVPQDTQLGNSVIFSTMLPKALGLVDQSILHGSKISITKINTLCIEFVPPSTLL